MVPVFSLFFPQHGDTTRIPAGQIWDVFPRLNGYPSTHVKKHLLNHICHHPSVSHEVPPRRGFDVVLSHQEKWSSMRFQKSSQKTYTRYDLRKQTVLWVYIRITISGKAREFIFQSRISIRKCLDTLMYPEAILSNVICWAWKKRIINVDWINAIPSFSIYIEPTPLYWDAHLSRIKHIPKEVQEIHQKAAKILVDRPAMMMFMLKKTCDQ